MKRDLLVLVPYPEKDLAQLQAAAGDLRVVTLPETAPEVQLRQALESARAVIGEPPVALLQDLPELAWIQMTWAGADRYTSDPAFPQHVRLSVAAGVYGPTIAEHVLAMLLALNRRLPAYQLQQRQGGWEDLGSERVLEGQTVVILGTGNIGRETAHRLQVFGAATIGVRRTGAGEMIPGFTTVTTLSQLDRLLPQADTLICCLPETAVTRGLLSRKRIAQMKQGSVLINVGRGSLVDTEALTQALQAGCLAGAGLDVTDPEPLPADHPLRRMPQVILTPHVAGVGFGHLPLTERRIRMLCLENVRRFVGGMAPNYLVDFKTGYQARPEGV